jgi:hypothetical protein
MVCLVWASLLEMPLEVVCRWPHRTLVTAHGSRDAPHARAAYLPIMAVIVAGHGRSPLKALVVPFFAAFDALLGVVTSDIG